ncbi:uncharacterized protein VP01_132g9 [Puccinia sorghi]|uniref:No apical meristem-associated C-terminal domain-containing protein n=1 Tax=Puccinia sorghi TaxID=27349 RepID=A0A0L6VMF8_9BASI|nr:uncharacterized protein VP01_132g9 [Puccinia sorghi]
MAHRPAKEKIYRRIHLPFIRKLRDELKKNGTNLTRNKINNRFAFICFQTLKFSKIYYQTKKKLISAGKDANEPVVVEAAKERYLQEDGRPFLFESAWNILRDSPRWTAMASRVEAAQHPSGTPSVSSYDPAADSPDDDASSLSHEIQHITNPSLPRRTSARLAAQGTPLSTCSTAHTKNLPGNSSTGSASINKPTNLTFSQPKCSSPRPTPVSRAPEPRFRPFGLSKNSPASGLFGNQPPLTPIVVIPTSCSSENSSESSGRTVPPSAVIPKLKKHPPIIPPSSPTVHDSPPPPPEEPSSTTPCHSPPTTTQIDAVSTVSKCQHSPMDPRSSRRKRCYSKVIKIESGSESGEIRKDNKNLCKTIKLDPDSPLNGPQNRVKACNIDSSSDPASPPSTPQVPPRQPSLTPSRLPRTPDQKAHFSPLIKARNAPANHACSSRRRSLATQEENKRAMLDGLGSPTVPPEEVRVENFNRLQLELKRLEAKSECERIELEIMKKDLRTCTDEYEREFFLFKKRRILARLKADETSPSHLAQPGPSCS